jgi:cytochrome c oxidase cbb3-type subunit III
MTTPAVLLLSASGMEIALMLTGIVTALAVLVVLVFMLLPEEDRTRMAQRSSRLRTYLLTGSTERVTEFDHDFDGIRELDNRIPPWFSTLFLVTILFAAVYLMNYHVFGSSKLMIEEYRDEVTAAEIQRRVTLAAEGTIDENTLVALLDAEALSRGGSEFAKYCVSCHGSRGEGLVGPNLTDQYWIHGAGVKNVYATIKNGVPAKGMISWQLVFTPKKIQEIASFVLTLQGTNPPNAKKPEGQLVVSADSSAARL